MAALIRYFSAFCVATVLAQTLIITVLLFSGRLTSDGMSKIAALACGIDISAERVQKALTSAKNQKVPSYDEILQKRTEESMELDLRRASLGNYVEFLKFKEEHLAGAEERFDRRRDAHRLEWEQRQAGLQTKAMKELQQTMEVMPPAQAKDQLVRMMDDGEIGNVVAIIQAVPIDKRKKILGEFVEPADADKLRDILRRIGEGDRDKALIDKALQDNAASSKNAPQPVE